MSDDLIFGCSTITHHDTPRESLRLLAQASEVGIVHFDTARAYGAGESERILGRHLKHRRGQAIVTTKYGLAPPNGTELLSRGYERAASSRRMRSALHALRRARKALRPPLFSPATIRTNLETSLRALRTDYVDYFLLHEAAVGDAMRPAVTRTLGQLVAEGKIREFGIGSEYRKIGPSEGSISASYRVLQFEHNPFSRVHWEAVTRPGRLVFTHSALSSMEQVGEALERNPSSAREWGAELGVDVRHPDVLPGLLLAYSHSYNAGGKVIFSTRSPQRIVDNVSAFRRVERWTDDRLLVLRRCFDNLAAQAN